MDELLEAVRRLNSAAVSFLSGESSREALASETRAMSSVLAHLSSPKGRAQINAMKRGPELFAAIAIAASELDDLGDSRVSQTIKTLDAALELVIAGSTEPADVPA